MKITNQNLPMIAGIIRKIASKNDILHTQNTYDSRVRSNIKRRKLGIVDISELDIEKSNVHSFEIKEIKVHDSFHRGEQYININNQGAEIDYSKDWDDDFGDDKWKATVIYVGGELTIKNNMLIIREPHVTNKKESMINKIWFTKS